MIIEELAKVFKGKLECLGENAEKFISCSVLISKELDNGRTITCKLKFIDSFRFMSTSLSKLVKYLSGRLHSDKCTDCKSKLDYMSFNANQLLFKCFGVKKIIKKSWIKN